MKQLTAGPGRLFQCSCAKIGSHVPLKIFITSRPNNVLHDLFSQLTVTQTSVQPDDSIRDIQLYVQSWSANLPADDSRERANWSKESSTSREARFLWTVLVVKSFARISPWKRFTMSCGSPARDGRALSSEPRQTGVIPDPRTSPNTSSLWAVCSVQRLTDEEMKDAVKLSLGKSVARRSSHQSSFICGHFTRVLISRAEST